MMVRRIALVAVAGLLAAGCGGDETPDPAAPDVEGAEVDVNAAGDGGSVAVGDVEVDVNTNGEVPEGMAIPLYEGGQVISSGTVEDPTLGTVASVSAVYPASNAQSLVALYDGYFEDASDINVTESNDAGVQTWSWVTADGGSSVQVSVADGETVANVALVESLTDQ